MGNKASCRVALRLDEPQRPHTAGELVSGKILFFAAKSSDLRSFQDIQLVLEGGEHVEILKQRQEHEQDTHSEVHTARNTIVHMIFPVIQFQGDLKHGQYEYPFRFRLPSSLPSSMVHRDQHCTKGLAEIRYTLSVNVAKLKKGVINGTELHDSKIIQVSARPSIQGLPVSSDSEVFPMTSCFFWNKGNIQMNWESDTDVCYPDGTFSVTISGENQSRVKVQNLSVKLVETIEYRSDRSNCRRSVKRTVVKENLSVEAFPWWQPRHKRVKNPFLGGRTSSARENLVQSHRISIKVPHDVNDSYEGDLITVRHTLVVTAETAIGCTTSPESACRFRVTRSSDVDLINVPTESPMNPEYQECSQMAEAEILPPDWNPTVAPDIFVVPEACIVLVDEGRISITPLGSNGSRRSQFATSANRASAPSENLIFPDIGSSTLWVTEAAAVPKLEDLQNLVQNNPENLNALLEDESWSNFVKSMTPREFCCMVQAAAHQGPRVARTLAVAMGPSMTAQHLLACIYALPDSSLRMEVLYQTASLASDLHSHISLIERELNRDELITFRSSLQTSKHQNLI